MADVAVISVISSGVVGVLGACSGFYAQRVTLRNEDAKRIEARRADLREILANAATTGLSYRTTHARTMGDAAVEVHEVQALMHPSLGHLGVRVGPEAEVYLAFHAFQESVGRLASALQAAPPEWSLDVLQVGAVVEEGHTQSRDAINTESRAAAAASDAFLVAAAAAIGSRP